MFNYTIPYIVVKCDFMENVFKDRVRAAREMRGFSQSELAEKAGFQPSAISHFETGGRSPSFDNLKRLADALSVSTDYLLGRVDSPSISGPIAGKLFRHAEKLSDDDLQALDSMAEALAKKNIKR
jgi:transcriptional regulator with XRE-family HTH domain